jgi:hypothetical protein
MTGTTMPGVERFRIESRTVQHVFAAITLALAGWEHLRRAHDVLLPSLEIAGGVMTLIEAVAKTRCAASRWAA